MRDPGQWHWPFLTTESEKQKTLIIVEVGNVKRIACMIIACLLAASLAGCGGADENMVKTPADMRMQRGRNYREVIEDFQDSRRAGTFRYKSNHPVSHL